VNAECLIALFAGDLRPVVRFVRSVVGTTGLAEQFAEIQSRLDAVAIGLTNHRVEVSGEAGSRGDWTNLGHLTRRSHITGPLQLSFLAAVP
jgi:hypothetical protein